MTVPILVLQALAVQRRAPRRRAQQKALRSNIPREPNLIAHTLKTEHRVIRVERHHVHAVRRIRRPRRDERRHRPRLVDALLENLPVLRLVIIQQRLAIHRLVQLPLRRINPNLAKQPVHPKRPRLIRNDRHNVAANILVPQQRAQQQHERLRRRGIRLVIALQQRGQIRQRRHLQLRRVDHALRQKSPERLASRDQIRVLRTPHLGPVKRRVRDHIIADRNVEPPAKLAQFLLIHLLLLMRDIPPLARLAQPVALDRFGQHHRRPPLAIHRGFVARVHLPRVVPAAVHLAQLLVRQVIHQREQLRILPKKMFANVTARLDRIFLIFAIHRFLHPLQQQTRLVIGQ